MNKAHEDETFGDSQEKLQKFVQEPKSENTVKKTSNELTCFTRFLGDINNSKRLSR